MLSKKDLRDLNNIISEIKHPEKGLEQEVFEALCPITTHVACEMVVANQRGEILLTYRRDSFWQGWHFPGGLLRFKESFFNRIKITAREELGVKLLSAKFLFPLNYINSARGHDVSFVFLCQIKGKPKAGRWFKAMPKNIIQEHRLLFKELKKINFPSLNTSQASLRGQIDYRPLAE